MSAVAEAWSDRHDSAPPSSAALYRELEAIEAELCRRSLRAFVERAWAIVEPDTAFVPNWHIDALCARLEEVTRGEIDRLLVNIPPGTAKSLIVSVFWPAWEWARTPGRRFLCASYSDTLTIRDSLKVRDICESAWFQEYFGLTFRSDQNQKIRMDTTAGGWRIATSVGGRGTGEHPDVIIIDDPTNPKEAASDAERQNANDWFDGTVATRGVSRGARIVVIMQRLHEADLSGHLLARGGWRHVCWPMRYDAAIASRDDARQAPAALLWPTLFDERRVALLERDLGSAKAAGQLQQRPAPAEGGLIKRAWFRWFGPDRLERGSTRLPLQKIVISVDTALKAKQTNDLSAVGAWGSAPPNVYGLKVVAGRWDFAELIREVVSVHAWCRARWPDILPSVLVENTAAGPDAVIALRREIQGVIAEAPKGDKVQRLSAVQPALEAGNVCLPGAARPDGRVETGLRDLPSWVDPFVEECAAFPNGTHDDQVDQMTQALRRLWLKSGGAAFGDIPGF